MSKRVSDLTPEELEKKRKQDRERAQLPENKLKRQAYLEKRKEHFANYRKTYRKDNEEKIKRYMDDYRVTQKEAIRETRIKYNEKNKVRIAKTAKVWHANNQEHLKEYRREYKEKNRDKVKKYMAEYRVSNSEAIKLSNKKWLKDEGNYKKRLRRNSERKSIKKTSIPIWYETERDLIDVVYQKAKELGFVVDHIVPLVSKKVCGLHTWANLQLLTAEINSKKRNLYWPDKP